MPFIDSWGITLLFSFFGIFGLIVSLMVNQERRIARQHTARAAVFGFQPVRNPSPALVKQIKTLHTWKAGQELEVRNLYHKRTLEANLYLFDLWEISTESAILLAESAVAVFMLPTVLIPRISLIPRCEGEDFLSYPGSWSLAQMITGLQMLAFADCPEFNAHYFAAGLEEPAARAFLTPELREHLAHIRRFHIEAASSIITLSEIEPGFYHSDAERAERIKSQITTGVTLARWLSVIGH